MDLFKLIYEHDLRLDQLRERHLDRSVQEVGLSIEAFMKPGPTYSRFYISGTLMDEFGSDHKFGVDRLSSFPKVIDALETALKKYRIFFQNSWVDLQEFIEKADIGDPAILTLKEQIEWDTEPLRIDSESNVGHRKSELAEILEEDDLVLYKEPALQGFDFHLFSKKNIYPELFYPIQKLIRVDFRFFSINGKRVQSERKFYFEIWTLDRPPHGAEEVFKFTKI